MNNDKGSILCMDDEEMIRITIGDFLEDCGYTVYLAKDGKEGLEIFREKTPDLLLVDLRMPEVNGFEVLSAVAKESPHTPIIVISGTGILRDAVEAIRLGAWNYITKPIEDMAFLEHSVKEALDKARLQRENIEYRENLEKMVLERTKALEEAHKQLRQAQKMEAIGTLAGGIAHDFNNILSAIIGYTEISKVKLGPESDVHKELNEVYSAGIRAKDLVSQILAFSRQGEQEFFPLILHPIAKEALKLLRSSIPATIEIKQDIHKCGTVMADATQIHQVMMNLCTNAYHAMEAEGGELEVGLRDVELGEQDVVPYPELNPGPFIQLTVSDTGSGMPPSIVERIFEPYFTTKEKGLGTGMGLSVVHGIVTSHGGAISVESEPGAGSTFHVYLPRVERKNEKKTDQDKPLPKGNERILIVDDEKPLAELGRQMLVKLGYGVVAMTDSLESLELFREDPDRFDLVITDMTMPHLTGDKLAKELMMIRPDIPIIISTGFSKQMDEDRAKEMGIKAFAMKPLVMRDLANTVRDVLDADRSEV